MRWRRVLCVTSLGISFFSANAESQTGTVSGEAPDAVVHFNNKTDSSYSMHAQSSGGWVFTEDFSWGGPNGWYSDAKYSIACERIPLVETAFVDASLCFGASMNGSMYKPGGEGGSPIPWSVSSAFHTAPQPYIYPAESIFAKGEPQALRYIVDNVMTSAPGGFWKYNGATVAGNSVQTGWQNIGSSYTLPSTLDAGLYTVNAARNSAGAFGASATVDIVGVKQLSATFGSTTITSTTDSPGENQTLYVPKVPSGSNITITATPEPGSAWPNNYPVWQGATGNGSTATFTPSSAGETIITATCGTSVKAIKIIVVEIVSISGLKDVYCTHKDCSQVVTAQLNPDISLPGGLTVTWGGDATFENVSGTTATAKFAAHEGLGKKITARLGALAAVESSTFDVIKLEEIKGISEVTYTFKTIDPGPQAYGVTIPKGVELLVTAYFVHPSHEWKPKITSAKSEIQWGYHRLNKQEATLAACTSEFIYREMIDSLNHVTHPAYKWTLLENTIAHEQVHIEDWKSIQRMFFSDTKTGIENLSLPYSQSCQTSDAASSHFNNSSDFLNFEIEHNVRCLKKWAEPQYKDGNEACDKRTRAAEQSVIIPFVNSLNQKAAVQVPPWTL